MISPHEPGTPATPEKPEKEAEKEKSSVEYRYNVKSFGTDFLTRDETIESHKIIFASVLLCVLVAVVITVYFIEYFSGDQSTPFDILSSVLIGIIGILIGFLFPAKFK